MMKVIWCVLIIRRAGMWLVNNGMENGWLIMEGIWLVDNWKEYSWLINERIMVSC